MYALLSKTLIVEDPIHVFEICQICTHALLPTYRTIFNASEKNYTRIYRDMPNTYLSISTLYRVLSGMVAKEFKAEAIEIQQRFQTFVSCYLIRQLKNSY